MPHRPHHPHQDKESSGEKKHKKSKKHKHGDRERSREKEAGTPSQTKLKIRMGGTPSMSPSREVDSQADKGLAPIPKITLKLGGGSVKITGQPE